MTRAQFDDRTARAADSDAPGDHVSFVVAVDGAAVGAASLFNFDWLAGHAEAGINLPPNARGRGIGAATVALLVEFGFVRGNLRRIHLRAIASNTAAIRAYDRPLSSTPFALQRFGAAQPRPSNGRTSTLPRHALDPSAASLSATSRSGASMIQKPPMTSLVSR